MNNNFGYTFKGYRGLFEQVGVCEFIPLLSPEELYNTDRIFNKVFKQKIKCYGKIDKKRYTLFEFILCFLKAEFIFEYITKFPKNKIKYNAVNHEMNDDNLEFYSSKDDDFMRILISMTEEIHYLSDNDLSDDPNIIKEIKNKDDTLALNIVKHAHEVWNYPFTHNSLFEAFNLYNYDIANYIISKNPELLYSEINGKVIFNGLSEFEKNSLEITKKNDTHS